MRSSTMESDKSTGRLKPLMASLAASLVLAAGNVYAATASSHQLEISDAGFSPKTLTIPAGKKVQLEIHNTRKLPSEFESYSLNRETLVPSGGQVKVWIGPLSPGHYTFFDDFNPGKTGEVIVKPAAKGAGNGQ